MMTLSGSSESDRKSLHLGRLFLIGSGEADASVWLAQLVEYFAAQLLQHDHFIQL